MKTRLTIAVALLALLSLPVAAADVSLVPAGVQLDAACDRAAHLRFDDQLVLIHDSACAPAAATPLARDVDGRRLRLVRDQRPVAERSGYRVLFELHGKSLALVDDPASLAGQTLIELRPITGDMVVSFKPERRDKEVDPQIVSLLAELDPLSYGGFISDLAVDIATRFACTDDVITARDLITFDFLGYGLQASTPVFNNFCYQCEGGTGFNVIGIKLGSVRPDEYYLVGAHYDSIAYGSVCTDARGANDNASGVAAVLELARVFADKQTESSIIFAAFGGEEQGLLGSYQYAADLAGQGLLTKLKGVVVLDMVSFYSSTYGVDLEGGDDNAGQTAWLTEVGSLAQEYTGLEVSSSVMEFGGSDHAPFLERGLPAVLLIESDWAQYTAYHTAADVYALQNMDFGVEITKVAGAALAKWAVLVAPDDDDDDDTGDDDDAVDDDDDDDDAADDDAADDDDDDDDDEACCG